MKRAIFGSILVVLAFVISTRAQEAKILYETGNFCCEDFRSSMDGFFAELSNRPGEQGVVIFYGGRNHPICANARTPKRGEIELIIKAFDQHIKFRKFSRERIELVFGGYREIWGAEFWTVPEGADRPKAKPTVEESAVKFKKGRAKSLDFRCEP